MLVLGGCVGSPEPRSTIQAEPFQAIIETLASPELEGRDAGTEGIERARYFLAGYFRGVGLEPAFRLDGRASYTQPFELPIGVTQEGEPVVARVENVGAILPGAGHLADEVVVVGAHYDHVGYGDVGARDKQRKGELHPGADDNASGTAGVLLLARHFAQRARESDGPRRTILFTCFAGEERGLLGSRYMTTHPQQWVFDRENVVAMINMDMVGRLRNDELYVFSDATGKQWREWTNAANEAVGLELKWDVRPPGGSDHSLFVAAGVPAVFFNTWLHEDYHTPGDTADKINAEGGAKVLSMVAALLDHTATTGDRLVFVAPPRPKPRPYLGVMIGDHERGVLLRDVAEDAPMHKAGAKSGDVLVSIGGVAVKTPGELRSFLNKAEPGDEVVAEVLRGEVTVELKVRLDLRR